MIKTEHLTKRYGPLTAAEDVTFEVGPGEVLGFLGPNGAGKTTTMRMLAGFVTPTSGTASICGHDIGSDTLAAKSALGYLPEGAPSYGEMTVRRFLYFIADLRALEGTRREARLKHVIDHLQLEGVLEQSIHTLSKGFRRRVGLAQAIMHDPPVLILDEPTDGLDPNQKHEVRTLINDMGRDKIIVISTHILEEVDAVCTRAIIVAQGRLLADGTPSQLEARSRHHNAVRLAISGEAPDAATALLRLPGVQSVEPVTDAEGAGLMIFPRQGHAIVSEVTDLVRTAGWPIAGMRVERGRLDDVFRAITAPAA